jgi:hypothetical protein
MARLNAKVSVPSVALSKFIISAKWGGAVAPNVSAQAGRAEGAGQTARRNPALPEADGSPSGDDVGSGAPEGQQENSPGQGRPRPPPWVKGHHTPTLFFPCPVCPESIRGKPDKKKRGDHFGSVTQGGARSSLALGYYLIVLTGLQIGSLRSHNGRVNVNEMGSVARISIFNVHVPILSRWASHFNVIVVLKRTPAKPCIANRKGCLLQGRLHYIPS